VEKAFVLLGIACVSELSKVFCERVSGNEHTVWPPLLCILPAGRCGQQQDLPSTG